MFRGSLMGVPRSHPRRFLMPRYRPRHCLKRSFLTADPATPTSVGGDWSGPAARPGWPPERQPAVRHADHFDAAGAVARPKKRSKRFQLSRSAVKS